MDSKNEPETIGPYRIESRLGSGGMGEVYRAYDRRLDRKVAIKKIRADVADDPKVRQRLRREARAVASLNHPAIVQIYDIVEQDDGDWIIMELIDGPTLHQLIQDGKISVLQGLVIGSEVASGLAEAHAHGIVHRDLKSENIMLTPSGRSKILDFGLAKKLWQGSADTQLSVQGSILGTGRAMSPEQAKGEEIDHRSDLFSLGSLLYETFTGRSPFQGSSIIHTLAQVCAERQKPAVELNPEIPGEVSEYLDFMLEKNPDRRPQSAGEVAAALVRMAAQLAPEEGLSSLSGLSWSVASSTSSLSRTPLEPTAWSDLGRAADRSPSSTLLLTGRTTEATTGVYIKTLVKVSLASERLPAAVGERRTYELLARHDRLVRDLLAEREGIEIQKTDSFLLLFERPVDAVQFCLAYQEQVAAVSAEEGVELLARAGVHLGEVFLRENTAADISRGARPLEVEGMSKLVVGRTTALAQEGQTLVTQGAYDLARRALTGITGATHRWISHGPYRFAGVEETVRLYEIAAAGVDRPPPPMRTAEAERVPDLDGTVSSHLSVVHGRKSWWLVAAVLLVAAVAVGLMVFQPSSQPPPAGPETAATAAGSGSVAVFSFRNLSGDPEVDWLSTALAEMLSIDLAAGEELHLVPGETVARLRNEIPALREGMELAEDTLAVVGKRLGSRYVVLGSYLGLPGPEGRQLRLQVHLKDTLTGGTVKSLSSTGPESALFDLVSKAGADLRAALGVGEISNEAAEAVRATLSASPEATRLYAEGLARLRSYDAQSARALLLRAVEEDPGYALAHAALSQAWSALGYDREATDSARRAYDLREGLPRSEALQIEGRYFEVRGEWDQAVATHEALWRFFPDSVDCGVHLVEAQVTAGRQRQALSTVEELRNLRPPLNEDPRILLAEVSVAFLLTEHERAIDLAEQAVARGKELSARLVVAEARQLQGSSLMHLGRLEQASEVLSEAERLYADAGDRGKVAEVLSERGTVELYSGNTTLAGELFDRAREVHLETGNRRAGARVLNASGLLYMSLGDLDEARRRFEEAIAADREVGDDNLEAEHLDSLVWLLIVRAEHDEAGERAQELLRRYREIGNEEGLAWTYFYEGTLRLLRGELAEAESWQARAGEFAERVGSDYTSGYVTHLRGEILLARGDLAAAESLLLANQRRREAFGDLTALAESRLALTRLRLMQGRAAEAVAEGRRAVDDLAAAGVRDDHLLAMCLTAEGLRLDGDRAAAAELYGEVREAAAGSQRPALRLFAAIVGARLEGETSEALRALAATVREAEQIGLVGVAFEARLAQAQVLVASGADARPQVEALVAAATARGFGWIAERAGTLSRPRAAL